MVNVEWTTSEQSNDVERAMERDPRADEKWRMDPGETTNWWLLLLPCKDGGASLWVTCAFPFSLSFFLLFLFFLLCVSMRLSPLNQEEHHHSCFFWTTRENRKSIFFVAFKWFVVNLFRCDLSLWWSTSFSRLQNVLVSMKGWNLFGKRCEKRENQAVSW